MSLLFRGYLAQKMKIRRQIYNPEHISVYAYRLLYGNNDGSHGANIPIYGERQTTCIRYVVAQKNIFF